MDENTPRDVAEEDAVIARVRAADPAAAIQPDVTALRSVVDERRAHEPGVAQGVPDELAARRSRRWTAWPAKVASVAAAALVVGGGGYVIGANHDSTDASPTTAEGVMALPDRGGAALGAGDADTAQLPMATGGGEESGYSSGRTVFTASGLSDEGGVMHAWVLDPSQSPTQENAASAASALGFSDTPELTGGSWMVGSKDGSNAVMQLSIDGNASLSYWDPGKDVWSCPADMTGVDGAGAGEADPNADMVAPSDPCEERDLGAAPQGDTATGPMKDVMTAVGVDPASYQFVVEDSGDPAVSYVTAYHLIDGQMTGLTWSATFTGAGLMSIDGPTAPLVDLGEYSVVSPTEAVERLTDPRFGSSWDGPMIMEDIQGITGAEGITSSDVVPAPDEPAPAVTSPATMKPGASIDWPVDEETIVEAKLGVALQWQLAGSSILVPTYRLTNASGAAWTVIAVADAQLDFASGE